MNNYLLLRNNKKSGPFNLQQLLEIGLKPYDLLWAEGKSAAWSYASEIGELKTYAPLVEEQPYDRLYKKPANENKPAEKKEVLIPEKIHLAESEIEMPVRKVFVSLPGNQSVLINNPPVQPAFSKKILKEEIVAEKKDPDLKEEYSESLNDIKKRYSEIYLNRKKKSKWNNNLKGVLQVVGGAAFICVLAVVVYNNFSTEVNKQRPEKSVTKSQVEKKQEAPLKTILSQQKQIPLITGNDQSQAMGKNEMKTDKYRIAEQEMVNNRNKVATQKKSSEKNPVIEKIKTIPDDGVKKVKETEIIPVIQRSVKKETESSYLRKSVSVSANNYKRRPFGGIMNLQLTITNNSRFILETAVVELEYMKPSEQPLKTEKIVFNSIAPFGSQTIKVPDFLRGVSVNYKIISIESSMGDKYNAGQ